jgi:hypothetical protein
MGNNVILYEDTNISESHAASFFISVVKIETACFSETLVSTDKKYMVSPPRR